MMRLATEREISSVYSTDLQILKDFTGYHRPSLREAGIRALDVAQDPTNVHKSFLLIEVRSRIRGTSEQPYYVTGAAVVTYDALAKQLPPIAAHMQQQLASLEEQQKSLGMKSAFFTVLSVTDKGACNVAGVGYGEEDLKDEEAGVSWREVLAEKLNERMSS